MTRTTIARIPLHRRIASASTVGARLAIARELAGLTMGQTSRLLLLSVGTVSDIESGAVPPSPVLVGKMCDYYGAHPHWVTTGERHDTPRMRGVERLDAMDAEDLRALLSVIA